MFKGLAILFALVGLALNAAADTKPYIFYATQSGKLAKDVGRKGGNPFADAFIEQLQKPVRSLDEFSRELKRLTIEYSDGWDQTPDGPIFSEDISWPFGKLGSTGKVALVLVVSDYMEANDLPGAARDALRVETALQNAGFETQLSLNETRAEISNRLLGFKERSKSADFAVIYATGHGVELDQVVYLVPKEYTGVEDDRGKPAEMMPITEIASGAVARRVNLVFFGGCRENPWAGTGTGRSLTKRAFRLGR
jgi:uncharacterized caspase-like protein